jgi:hypothetical protein
VVTHLKSAPFVKALLGFDFSNEVEYTTKGGETKTKKNNRGIWLNGGLGFEGVSVGFGGQVKRLQLNLETLFGFDFSPSPFRIKLSSRLYFPPAGK